jgi:predicted nucleic acid-binding protein
LFDVYGKVTTTPEIAAEYGENLPLWIDINVVADKSKQRLLEMQIDKGESSAIALALETPNSLLIIDDFKARRIAERLALSFTGTIGVIIKAKLLGIIPSIKPIIERIKETDFRLSPELELQALIAAKEK